MAFGSDLLWGTSDDYFSNATIYFYSDKGKRLGFQNVSPGFDNVVGTDDDWQNGFTSIERTRTSPEERLVVSYSNAGPDQLPFTGDETIVRYKVIKDTISGSNTQHYITLATSPTLIDADLAAGKAAFWIAETEMIRTDTCD